MSQLVVDEHLGAREPAAVHDRGVVELVGEDHDAGTRKRRDDAEAGEIARAEQQRRLAALDSVRRSSSRRWIVIVPDTSRDAPAPQPQRVAASAAATRSCG